MLGRFRDSVQLTRAPLRGEYDRKVETQKVLRGPQAIGAWFNSKQREEPWVLTSDRSRDEFSFGTEVTGGAWLSSARVVNVGLSPATSATPIVSCHPFSWAL